MLAQKSLIPPILGIGLYDRLLVVAFLSTLNIVTLGQITNLFIAVPQYIFVLYLIVKGDIKGALFVHFVFSVTCISVLNAVGFSEEKYSLVIYSYSRLKLIGPVSVSYVLWILLLFASLRNKVDKFQPIDSLFCKSFKYFVILDICANILGVFGLIFLNGYDLNQFVSYNVYINVTIVAMYCLLRNYSYTLVKAFYDYALPLILGSILSSYIGFFFLGVATSYGAYEDIMLQTDVLYFGIIPIFAIFWYREKVFILIFVILFIASNLISSSGKSLLFIAIGFLFWTYYIFFDKSLYKYNRSLISSLRKLLVILVGAFILLMLPMITIEGNLFAQKLQDITSLFTTDISSIDRSPYIRIASTLNIFENNKYNPIGLLFGQGYGGYFTDELGLFTGISLEGAWTDETAASGRFSSAHDTFALVPLLNGLVGFCMLVQITWLYIKRIKYNYLSFAVVPWIFFTFYYNVIYSLLGVFFIFAAEYSKDNNREL